MEQQLAVSAAEAAPTRRALGYSPRVSGTLNLLVPVVVESLGDERARVAPLSARAYLTHGEEADAIAELASFLEERLEHAAPSDIASLAAYGTEGHHALRVIRVHLSLSEHERSTTDVDFACVVLGPHARSLARAHAHDSPETIATREARAERPPLPTGQLETWVVIPVLDHVFRVPDDLALDDEVAFDACIAHEVLRVIAATSQTPLDVLVHQPPTATRVHLLSLSVRRSELSGRAGPERSVHEAERQRREESRRLLERMGRRLGHTAAPALRSREIAELERLLSSKERLAVLVRGPELAGKSAVLAHVLGSLPGPAYAVPLARFLAGDGGFGEWQTRTDACFRAAEALDATIYVEDLGGLALERPGSPVDLAAAIAPFLESRRVRFVGEIRDTELDRFESRNRRLSGTLLRVRVDAMSEADTTDVLVRTHGPSPSSTSRRATVHALQAFTPLVTRYLPDRALPGEAVRTLNELIETLTAPRDEHGLLPLIERSELVNAFAARVGIPPVLVRDDLPMPPREVAAALRARVIGQQDAVDLVASTLGVVKAGLPPSGKPIATFLFVGPTGTGKTELARALAGYLFGSAEALARFDMSEFMDPWAADRLIRGTDREDGLLTRRARERPFSVLLLDEIEKAHPGVFDLLLQVLGEGRLTDARGKMASFTNCIVVMTSNLGARSDRPLVGFAQADAATSDESIRLRRERYLRAVRDHFRPELLNRIDRVVPFRALLKAEAADIARLFLRGIERRAGIVDRGHTLMVDESALDHVIDGVMEAGGGARALRRALEDTLVIGVARVLSLAPAARQPIRALLPSEPVRPGCDRIEHAGLAFEVERRAGPHASSVDRGALSTITDLRRRSSRWCRLSSIDAMRTEVARLVSEVARARRRGDSTSGDGLERRLGFFQTKLDACDELLARIELAEEWALNAVARDEDASHLVPDARRAAWELEEAVCRTARAWNGDEDSVERTVTVVGRLSEALGLFLLPLLERAEALSILVYLPTGIAPAALDPARSAWPKTRAWGPYLDAAEALAFLRTSPRLTAPTWGARAASVFLSVEGANVYPTMRPLEGLVRFRHQGALHDVYLATPSDLPENDRATLPELAQVPSTPHVLIDLDRGRIHLEGADAPLEIDPPDAPGADPGRWVHALSRLAVTAQLLDEGS